MLQAAMNSDGALRYVDLYEMTIPEAESTIVALGYILDRRSAAMRAENDRIMRRFRSR